MASTAMRSFASLRMTRKEDGTNPRGCRLPGSPLPPHFVSSQEPGSLAWAPMTLLRRRSAIAGLSSLPLAGLPRLAARAQAADFPDRPLRFVVGFPPGGPNDLLARIVAPGIAERLKRSVEVENRAGANGEIAAASVAKPPPDRSVFMLASNGSTPAAPP